MQSRLCNPLRRTREAFLVLYSLYSTYERIARYSRYTWPRRDPKLLPRLPVLAAALPFAAAPARTTTMADESSSIQEAALQVLSEARSALPKAAKHLEEQYGIPAEIVLPASAALLLMVCTLLCCCLRGKGESKGEALGKDEALLPKHVARSDLIRADAPQLAPQVEEAKTVTIVVANAEQEGGRGGGWGDLDGFDPSITINRQEYPTSRRGAELSKYFVEDAPPVARRGAKEGASTKKGSVMRGWGSGRKG